MTIKITFKRGSKTKTKKYNKIDLVVSPTGTHNLALIRLGGASTIIDYRDTQSISIDSIYKAWSK